MPAFVIPPVLSLIPDASSSSSCTARGNKPAVRAATFATAAAASLAALVLSLHHPLPVNALPKLGPPGLPSIGLPSIPLPSLGGNSGDADDSVARDSAPNSLSREDEKTADDLIQRMEAKRRERAAHD